MAAAAMQQQHGASLTGAWVLDVARSESMAPYLHLLDVPLAHIPAQLELEQVVPSRNVIVLNEGVLTLYKRTAVNHFTEALELGVEKVFQAPNSGIIKRVTASLINDDELSGYVYAGNTVVPGGCNVSVVDARRLEPGGESHTQTLTVQNNATGERCTIRRTWVRVPMSRNDLQRLGGRAVGE